MAFLAGTLALAAAAAAAAAMAALATAAFFGRSFQDSSSLKFLYFSLDYSVPHFLCLHDLETIKVCHLGFPFSGINFLGPSCGCPFRIDIRLLPSFSDILLAGTVWELEDEVSELHAFEGHGRLQEIPGCASRIQRRGVDWIQTEDFHWFAVDA